jgi:hypothetical protein
MGIYASTVRVQNAEVGAGVLRTLTVLIPRRYNPDQNGVRRKVEISKISTTLREIKLLFSGYSVSSAKGWNRGDNIRDEHLRFEIDLEITPARLQMLREWKTLLERRFEQRSIYMKLSDRTMWL